MDLNQALEITRTIKRVSPYGAFLCGGAPRDKLMGNQPKDFDIFVPAEPTNVLTLVRDIRKQVQGFGRLMRPAPQTNLVYQSVLQEAQPETYNSYFRPEVLGVMKNKDIDVVFHDSRFGVKPQDIVAMFDNSLSMAWFDDSGAVRSNALFKHSIREKVILAIPGNTGNGLHLARIADKFPAFTLIADPV